MMIPTAAMNRITDRVEPIDPKATGYEVHATVMTKISHTWLASHTGPMARCAWSRTCPAPNPFPAVSSQKPAPEVGAAEHGVHDQADQHEHHRDYVQMHRLRHQQRPWDAVARAVAEEHWQAVSA